MQRRSLNTAPVVYGTVPADTASKLNFRGFFTLSHLVLRATRSALSSSFLFYPRYDIPREPSLYIRTVLITL